MTIETKKLVISDKLKRKIDMIRRFTNTTPIINNGSIKNIIGTPIFDTCKLKIAIQVW